MIILFINYYIDKNRSPHGGDETLMWPLYLAKKNEVYVYQGIKGTKHIKDGKVCRINSDSTNTIIDGDPNNQRQKPGDHTKWDYPNPSSKFSNIILNSDVIVILGEPAHKDYFQPELNKTKAFIIQQPIYTKPLPISNYILRNDSFARVISDETNTIIKKYRTNTKINNYDIGLVGTIIQRKGQLDFFSKLNPNKVSQYTFHIVGPVKEKSYLNKIINTCKAKDIKYKFYGKLEGEEYFKHLSSFKCIVHYSRVDANPRVIWDSIYCGTPYFASNNCEIPEIIHNYGFIDNDINGFYKLLDTDYKDNIYEFVDNNLQPEKYVNELFLNIINKFKNLLN